MKDLPSGIDGRRDDILHRGPCAPEVAVHQCRDPRHDIADLCAKIFFEDPGDFFDLVDNERQDRLHIGIPPIRYRIADGINDRLDFVPILPRQINPADQRRDGQEHRV